MHACLHACMHAHLKDLDRLEQPAGAEATAVVADPDPFNLADPLEVFEREHITLAVLEWVGVSLRVLAINPSNVCACACVNVCTHPCARACACRLCIHIGAWLERGLRVEDLPRAQDEPAAACRRTISTKRPRQCRRNMSAPSAPLSGSSASLM